MKSIYHKIKEWYRGKPIPYSLQEMMDLQRPIYPDAHDRELPDRFDSPLIARIINAICRFWLSHWKWIIGTILTTLLVIAAFLTVTR